DRSEHALPWEEVLVRDLPGKAALRIVDALELGAERAVLVRTHRGREEEPVANGRVFLDEDAPRLLQGERFRCRRRCACARRLCARRQRGATGVVLVLTII